MSLSRVGWRLVPVEVQGDDDIVHSIMKIMGYVINLTKTRAKGEDLMGNENKTMGVVPIMKNLDQSQRHINQG